MVPSAITVLLLLCTAALPVHAQHASADSTLKDTALDHAVGYYFKNIGEQAEIYNGREYLFAPKAYKGNPYFQDTLLFKPGTVRYNGTWYKNISLLYDSYRDVLVAARPVNQAVFIVRDTLVAEFYVAGQHFLRITPADSAGKVLKPGYYQTLYTGKTKVLIKHYKARSERVIFPAVEVSFIPQVEYYITKNNNTYGVGSKSSVLKVFKDKKRELNSYLKKNNINYDADRTLAITQLAAYYDQVSP